MHFLVNDDIIVFRLPCPWLLFISWVILFNRRTLLNFVCHIPCMQQIAYLFWILESSKWFKVPTKNVLHLLTLVCCLHTWMSSLNFVLLCFACTLLIDGLDYSCYSHKETSMFLFITHLPYRMLLFYIAVFVMYRLQLLSLFHGWYSETQYRVWMPLDVLWHLLDVHSTDMWGTCSHNSHQEPLPLEHPGHPGHR